jgi:hypothetical protein
MPDQWEQIAASLRHRARRLVSLRGLAWSGLVVVGLLWIVGLADWLLHLDTPWLRLLLAIGIAGSIGVTVWKTLWRPLQVRLTDVDIARLVERRFPRWGDQLSSAAQFREEHYSERLGSAALQQTITAGVDDRLGQIDLEQVLDPQPTRRLGLIALVICVLGVSLALWQRSAAATALTRLALPFSDVQWPRTAELRFLNDDLRPVEQREQRTAAGEPFALYLENALGSLPDDVLLLLRLADGRSEERSLQTTSMRDEGGGMRDVGIISLTAHEGPIHFRAIGGDDEDMPWITLDVVPPPALASITLTITPPAYSAAPPETMTTAGQIEALVGSRVQISAQANTPLKKAFLRREGYQPQSMKLTAGDHQVDVAFVIEQAGHGWYWFDIADDHGLSPGHPPRYELRGIADRKPTVFIDQPAADVTLTPDADLPLRIIARDDLGVKALRLVHSRPGEGPTMLSLPLSSSLPTDETVEWIWRLAPLGLQSGDRISFHAEAVDAFDLPAADGETSPPGVPVGPEDAAANDVPPAVRASRVVRPPGEVGQVGLSASRNIEILSTEDKRRELATRQMGVLESLQLLRQQQSRAAESTAGLRIQAELAERLQQDDLDLLKQTELEQQQIREQLNNPQSGVPQEIARLRAELDRNHIDDPQMAGRLEQLREDLRSLSDELLPAIEQSLARARKGSQPESATDAQTQQQLRQAEQAQSQALSVLEEATTRLGGWQRQFEITSTLDEIIADQTAIQRQTQETGRQTLSRRTDPLPPQQQADLARLSDRQRRLASRLEQLLKQGTEAPSDSRPVDQNAEAMQAALRKLAQRSTVAHMHNAAESLRRNDIAATARAQEQVLDDLRQFGEFLQAGADNAAESLLSTLEEQLDEVETLHKQQADLLQQARQALGPSADPERAQQLQRLRKQQQELADQADALARQLQRQQQQHGAQTANRAARRMQEAHQAIEREQAAQTGEAQNEALDDLAQLATELTERQRQIEREVARQQIEQLAADLRNLADLQEGLISRTLDLDERQQQRGSWSRSLRRELQELTTAQAEAADQLDVLRSGVSSYPVIDLSLQQAAEPMRSALELLQQNEAGATTHQQQRTARQRLLALAEVIGEAQRAAAGQAQSGPPQNQNRPPAEDGQPQIPQLLGTQLKLLRHLQADVRQRTATLTQQIQSGEVDADDVQVQRQQVTRDQQKIAELARTLLEQFTQSGENTGTQVQRKQEQP